MLIFCLNSAFRIYFNMRGTQPKRKKGPVYKLVKVKYIYIYI